MNSLFLKDQSVKKNRLISKDFNYPVNMNYGPEVLFFKYCFEKCVNAYLNDALNELIRSFRFYSNFFLNSCLPLIYF